MKCLNCNKQLVNRQKKFCSNKCQKEYYYKEYIEQWKNGNVNGSSGQFGTSNHIKHYLLERAHGKCEKCG